MPGLRVDGRQGRVREHLSIAPRVARKRTIARIDRLVVAADKVIRHAKPSDGKPVGAVEAKGSFEPWQALRGLAGPHRDGAAVSIVVGVARINFERAVESPESKVVTFPKQIDIGEKAVRARGRRI